MASDGRALNYASWRYTERIRQLDELIDEAELRGIADAPPELTPLGIGLGWTLWLLERARIAEDVDREPANPPYIECDVVASSAQTWLQVQWDAEAALPAIEDWLYCAAHPTLWNEGAS